jgi:hypothetical protein
VRLRNKKTGEIKEVIVGGYPVSGKTKMWECSEMDANEETGYKSLGTYTSLAELNAEWEDYEEPKVYWFINDLDGEPMKCDWRNCGKQNFARWSELRKEIGNYFETKEEAEKAVEKLKAWKRLKDKGVKLYGWRKNQTGTYDFLARWEDIPPKMTDIINDLDLLFGGEE